MIVEPIIQGAGGMRIYARDFLFRLRQWTSKHHIHLIADEIMTGIGRCGKMLACQYAAIEPDLLCLSKGLTAGVMPLSALLMRESIYELFYDDYASGKSFLHSHTFSGHALAASVALEVLNIIKEEHLCECANVIGQMMYRYMQDIAQQTEQLVNVRQLGAIVAADLVCEEPNRRLGFEIFQKAIQLGAYLRPLGNTIYWLPPLNIAEETLCRLKQVTEQAIKQVCLTR